MSKVINCECGRQIRGDSDEELLTRAEAHVSEDHPELVETRRRLEAHG